MSVVACTRASAAAVSTYACALCLITHSDNNYTPVDLKHKGPLVELQAAKATNKNLVNRKLKTLHGRHLHDWSQEHIDKEALNYWFTHGELYPQTKVFVMAIQDQVIATKNYLKPIIKDPGKRNGT